MKITSKYIKKYTPKSLLGRIMLILILPTIIAQAASIYIFYERHIQRVERQLAVSLAAEVATITDFIESADSREREQTYLKRAYRLFAFSPQLMSFNDAKKHTNGLKMDGPWLYKQQLKEKLGARPFEVYTDNTKVISTLVYLGNSVLVVDVQRKRLISSTTYIFLLWMTGISTLLLIVSIIFLKNQIRPVVRLARLADNLGRGNDLSYAYKPEGASEVRLAYKAFINMHQRITRFVKQRTDMLAGISHDLRTPLTRMKLELALLKDKPDFVEEMEKDLAELEHMINSYIDFARGDEGEEASKLDIADLLKEIAAKYKGFDIEVNATSFAMYIRPNAMTRAIKNIIDNAQKYAKKLKITLRKEPDYISIEFADNGPGIAADKREEVFKPFYRIEQSRNPETGGTGLGLSIVRDIIGAHGGTVSVDDSELGGAKVVVRLPV